jgi:hypothetical protein
LIVTNATYGKIRNKVFWTRTWNLLKPHIDSIAIVFNLHFAFQSFLVMPWATQNATKMLTKLSNISWSKNTLVHVIKT